MPSSDWVFWTGLFLIFEAQIRLSIGTNCLKICRHEYAVKLLFKGVLKCEIGFFVVEFLTI